MTPAPIDALLFRLNELAVIMFFGIDPEIGR
jgi:hypothetical protein